MDQALSLKTGEYVLANTARHTSSKNLLLVCPECGEPVYFKAREIPYVTPFFAHYKELEIIKLTRNCSLRIVGSTFQKASNFLPNISQGQLVDKFQKSFCIELHKMFGKCAEPLIDFIRLSNFLPLERRDYKDLINKIENFSAFQDIHLSQLTRSDLAHMAEGMSDICTFLRSQYGSWVGNFIYQTAYFLACIIHPETLNSNLGKILSKAGKDDAIFIAEPFRIKSYRTYASEILPETSKRNSVIPKISSIIIALLICKWRHNKGGARLLKIADEIEPAFKKNITPKSVRPSSITQLSSPSYGFEKDTFIKEHQVKTRQEELNSIRSWHSKTPNPTSEAKTLTPATTSHSNQKSKISNSLLERLSATRDTTLPTIQGKVFNYRITEKDILRIRNLVERAINLYKPSKLSNQDELMHWAKTPILFEAYFMAEYLKIPHQKVNFSDYTLTEKLHAWLRWAYANKA